MNHEDLKFSVPTAIAAHNSAELPSLPARYGLVAFAAALAPRPKRAAAHGVSLLPSAGQAAVKQDLPERTRGRLCTQHLRLVKKLQACGKAQSKQSGLGRRLIRYVLSLSIGFLGLLGFAAQGLAAGGHHAVDDAVILEPQQCQLDTWLSRDNGGARTLVHLGPLCRVGPVELGLNLERTRQIGSDTTFSGAPQIKWALPVTESLSAAVVASAGLQNRAMRFSGSSLVFPLTWQTQEDVLIHANLGRDFRRGLPDTNRAGAAVEWAPLEQWSFVAERYRESASNYWRIGTRYALNSSLNLDLSEARGMGGSAPGFWTFGVTWTFDR